MKKTEKKIDEVENQETEVQEAEVTCKSCEELQAELNTANDKIATLEQKGQELNDKYLRVLAEYDNFRKRSQKEKETAYKDAYVDAVTGILPVVDNVERALEFAADENDRKGIELIVSAIHTTLEKMGVKEIETNVFDPNLHNAVMHIDDENLGEGEIVEVFQKGYILGERVIRYAMVKVAN